MPQARELVGKHRERGDTLVLTTATNRFLAEPIAASLGMDHLIATELETEDEVFTGRNAGVLNMREGKVERLHAWLAERGLQAGFARRRLVLQRLDQRRGAVAVGRKTGRGRSRRPPGRAGRGGRLADRPAGALRRACQPAALNETSPTGSDVRVAATVVAGTLGSASCRAASVSAARAAFRRDASRATSRAASARRSASATDSPASIWTVPTLQSDLGDARRDLPVVDARVQALHDVGGIDLARARQDHGELVAAEATGDVAPAQRLAQGGADLPQRLVADGVAEQLVDALEAVDVEDEHASPLPVPP